MFVRLLFLLLLALNLGVAGWLAFGHTPPPPATDPGVPELTLLSERHAAGQPAAAVAARTSAASAPARAGDRCYSLGPFSTEAGMRAALDALTPHVARIQFRQEQTTASRGWWVYLPALPSREDALETARTLAGEGVRDYYVVTAGEHENTISLGLFRNPDNARRRQQQIAALGVKPALTERIDQVPQWFIDYAVAAHAAVNWRKLVQPASAVSAQPMDCF